MAILPVLENNHKKQRTSDCRTLLADVTFQVKLMGCCIRIDIANCHTELAPFVHTLSRLPHYVLSTAPIKQKIPRRHTDDFLGSHLLLLQHLVDDDKSKTGRLITAV